MADWRDKDEAAHEFGRVQRHGEAENAGQRMNDDDRLSDASARQSFAHHPRLAFGRGGGAREHARAPAMPRTIDAENAKAERGETIGERDAHVREIARRAVDEQNGAAFGAAGSALHDMDRPGAGLDEFADGRKARLDPLRFDEGEEKQADETGGRQTREPRDHRRPRS